MVLGRVVKQFLVLVVAWAVALSLGSHEARAGQCGLPDVQPLWMDFSDGSVQFRNMIFGRPGVIAATSGALVPPQLRARGAQTVYWEMKLSSLVGTTVTPADPAGVDAAAAKLFAKATASSGCATPLIALNELHGAGTTTPWTANNAQYRANVLALLRGLAARGARPFLLIAGIPYTGAEAGEWWRQAAEVADLVPEAYFGAPVLHRRGALLAGRQLRVGFRAAVETFTGLGIPSSRIGLVLGFQSGAGRAGREGLAPSSAWFEVVKWQTLAAKQAASELGIGSILTWGWGTFSEASRDPDKSAAACVYLWARDASLCDAPAVAGEDFNASLTDGQIALPPDVQCSVGEGEIHSSALARLAAITGDRDVAFTALLERLVESSAVEIDAGLVLATERTIVVARFGGSQAAYRAAIARAGATIDLARSVIADELRRALLASGLQAVVPSSSAIETFYQFYAEARVRRVAASPAPPWLGGRGEGVVLAAVAPAGIFSLKPGRLATLRTAGGTYQVRVLGGAFPLGTLPLSVARPAIETALLAFAQADALGAWTVRKQTAALESATCLGDDLPAVSSVDLTAYLPFLAILG